MSKKSFEYLSDPLWSIVPAAGLGLRMGAEVPKQYLQIAGRPLLEWTLERLMQSVDGNRLVVVLRQGDPYWAGLFEHVKRSVDVCEGGAERCDSVYQGLLHCVKKGACDQDWVLVHDSVRPCVPERDISNLMQAVKDHEVGGVLGAPVVDSVRRACVDEAGCVQMTQAVDREGLWRVFTPQLFRLGLLKAALENAFAQKQLVTDESEALLVLGFKPLVVVGSVDNIKVTEIGDLEKLAEFMKLQHALEALWE